VELLDFCWLVYLSFYFFLLVLYFFYSRGYFLKLVDFFLFMGVLRHIFFITNIIRWGNPYPFFIFPGYFLVYVFFWLANFSYWAEFYDWFYFFLFVFIRISVPFFWFFLV